MRVEKDGFFWSVINNTGVKLYTGLTSQECYDWIWLQRL